MPLAAFDYRRDDQDDTRVYGGRVRTPAEDGIPADPTYISDLQQLLLRLDFRVVLGFNAAMGPPQPNRFTRGRFDAYTEWAVREFQSYAKMPKLRRGEGEDAEAVDNQLPYSGPVCGVVNAETRDLLQTWDTLGLRCPVTISAFTPPVPPAPPDTVEPATPPFVLRRTGLPDLPGGNLWIREQMPSTAPRIYARDLSGLYTRTGGTADEQDLTKFQVLGEYANVYNTGPQSIPPRHEWREAQVSDDKFGPVPAADEEKRAFFSTFRVIAAVARVECIGYLDCINAYDTGIQSFGLVHWTLALPAPAPAAGQWGAAELPATLAYFAQAAGAAAYRDAFGRYGMGVTPSWPLRSGGASGLRLRNATERKFQGLVTLQAEDGEFDARPWLPEEIEYLRGWHWLYRFAMAGRLQTSVPKPLWDMARVRLRDLLAVSWPDEDGFPKDGARAAKLGETFTSEKAVAILVRWHVLRPAALVARVPVGNASVEKLDLRKMWELATGDGGGAFPADVDDWGETEQRRLIRAMVRRANDCGGEIKNSVQLLAKWFIPTDAEANLYPSQFGLGGRDPAVELHQVADPPPDLIEAFNRNVDNLGATDAVRAFLNGLLDVDLATNVRLIRRVRNRRWEVQEFHPDLTGLGDADLGMLRRFKVTRDTDTSPLVVREVPTLSIREASFKFHVDGLPAPPNTAPIGTRTVPAADLAEGPITATLKLALTQLVAAGLPNTPVNLEGARVVVEETGEPLRWRVLLGPGDGTPDVLRPSLTLRKTGEDSGNIVVACDPPGCSQRYRGLDLGAAASPPAVEVLRLRGDLRTLGFLGVSATGDTYTADLRAAVRDLQAYARRPFVARVSNTAAATYADTLAAVANDLPYTGLVSGVVNAETRAVIDHWVSGRNQYRCPAVVQACSDPAGSTFVDGKGNLWRPEDDPDESHRMFVVDYSGGSRQRAALGTYAVAGGTAGPRVRNDPQFRPARAEATPERLAGSGTLSDSRKKVFRVVRAVLEGSCGGFLDGIDSSTAAVTSVGPFRLGDRVAGTGDGAKFSGGLGALFSHAREYELTDFRQGIEGEGVHADAVWHPLGRPSDGRQLFDQKSRETTCGVTFEREGYPLTSLDRRGPPVGPAGEATFRGWHWAHRLAAVARRPGFGRSVWELLRVRVQDVSTAPWPNNDLNAAGSVPTLSDVATSETAWAVILLWHLRHPAEIIKDRKVHPALAQAVKDAGLTTPPAGWGDVEESKLLTALFAYLGSTHPSSSDPFLSELRETTSWPAWGTADPADNPRGYTLSLAPLVETKTITPTADPTADLNGGTVPDEVRQACAELTHDTMWTAQAPAVVTVRAGAFWAASIGCRAVTLLKRGGDLDISLGLRPRRKSFTCSPPDLGTLPPRPVPTAGSSIGTAVVELCPSKKNGDRFDFGICLVSTDFEDSDLSGPRVYKEVVFSRAGDTDADPFRGVRIPLTAPVTLDLKLEESARVGQAGAAGEAPEEVPVFAPTADSPLPAGTLELPLDISALLDPSAVVSLANAKLVLGGATADTALAFDAGLGYVVGRLRVVVDADIPFLRDPVTLAFAGSGDRAAEAPDFRAFAWDEETGLAAFDPAMLAGKLKGFPFGLPANLPFSLKTGAPAGKLDGGFTATLTSLPRVDLGSPLAQLALGCPLGLGLALHDGLSLAVAEGQSLVADLGLDLFAEAPGADPKVINHLWESLAPGDGADFGKLLKLAAPAGTPAPDGPILTWRDRRPAIHPDVLAALTKPTVNSLRRLRSFAGDLLGTAIPTLTRFRAVGAELARLVTSADGATYRIEVPLGVVFQREGAAGNDPAVFEAEGTFGFEVGLATTGASVRLSSGALKVLPEVTLRVNSDEFARGFRLGDLISFHVPRGTAFTFRTDPRDPSLRYDLPRTQEKTQQKIVVRVPASDGIAPEKLPEPEDRRFSFEIGKLEVNSRGFDLKGTVRAEKVGFGEELDSGFDTGTGLAVQRPESKDGSSEGTERATGELEFRNSRLVYGSLQAACKLRYFDDATGTFRVLIAQDEATKDLQVQGSFDISGLVEYRLDALFALFQVRHLHIGTKWDTGTKKWFSEGRMTGAVRFQPAQGHSAGEAGPLSDLFSGVTCEFENLNPVKIGAGTAVRFTFPPKQFEFAEVFLVDLQGISVGVVQNGVFSFDLLGEVTLQKLTGVVSRLTFGGITLRGASDGKPPKFSVRKIGAAITAAGAFSLEGEIEYIENEREVGFGGAATIRTEALPPLSGLVKLTLAKTEEDRKTVPTIAVYFETDFELPLFAELYLRTLGVGLGINQALRGLEHRPNAEPLASRIAKFVDDPQGLPNPRTLAAWVPNPPATASKPPRWMAVASGLITLTKAPLDTAHPLVGSVLLAVGQELDLTLGINLWLFTSPNEAQSVEFQRNPVARGAVAFSPREGAISAYFRTLPEPKLGKDAPPVLGEVLRRVRTSLRFQADRNGFLFEVGWPWETQVELPLPPPFRGIVSTGYRYGLYRGVLCFGYNFGVEVGLDAGIGVNFSTPLGDAGASLSVTGGGYFRCSFAGALDPAFRPYLLGDVRVGATVRVRAEAHVSLSRKISRWFKIKLRIEFSASFNISISAALTAALDSAGVGFDGDARVAVSVKGYRIAGQVPFKYNADKIGTVRARLDELLPPPIGGSFGGFALAGEAEPAPLAVPSGWVYRYRRGPGRTLLVSLLPQSGRDYPGLDGDPNSPPSGPVDDRYALILTAKGASRFRGFLGDALLPTPDPATHLLKWSEDLDFVLLTTEQILADSEVEPWFVVTDAVLARLRAASIPPAVITALEAIKDEEFDGRESFLAAISRLLSGDQMASFQDVVTRESQANTAADGAAPRPLTVRHFLAALHESQQDPGARWTAGSGGEEVDPRTKNPTVADTDDETAGVAPEGQHSPYLRRDNPYDGMVSDACRRERRTGTGADGESQGLSTGLLAAEVLSLFGDERGAENADARAFTVAPHLRSILVFELDDDTATLPDPVPSFIELEDGGGQPVKHRLAGDADVTISSVTGAAVGREYDLIPGRIFQSNTEVALAWDFRFEDQSDGDNPLPVYEAGFETFRVTRTNLSDQGGKPKVVDVAPCWLDPGDGKLVRPQFQFVDQEAAGESEEGDLLQYRVDAIGQAGAAEPLASCLFNVVRKTVRPLAPVAQAVVLHLPQAAPVQGDPTAYEDDGTVEIAVLRPEAEAGGDAIDPAELQIRVRIVAAAGFEPYGFPVAPEVSTVERPALPKPAAQGLGGPGKEAPEIRFAEPSRGRPLPWAETAALNPPDGRPWDWKLIHMRLGDEPPREVGLRVRLPLKKFLALVRASLTVPAPPGFAVEVSIGRNRSGGQLAADEPTTRSVLTTCRHAVVLTPAVESEPDVVARTYFSQGNVVPALEPLPTFRPPPAAGRFLETAHVATAPDHTPDGPPTLGVRWRMPVEGGGGFDPVVGFRLHRVDRLDPYRYRPRAEGLSPVVERVIRVLPEGIVRSTPNTIELRSLRTRNDQTGAMEVTADWRPGEAVGIWDVPAPPSGAVEFPYGYAPGQARRSWLHRGLIRVMGRLLELLKKDEFGGWAGASIALSPQGRMEDKADPLAERDRGADPSAVARRAERFLAAFVPFASGHTDQDDPYGWAASAAIGLSCEIILLDRRGDPIPIDELVRERDLFDQLKQHWGTAVVPPVSIGLFVADDGRSFLNLLRLTHARQWPRTAPADTDDFRPGTSSKIAVLGRDPKAAGLPTRDELLLGRSEVQQVLDGWAVSAFGRVTRGLRPAGSATASGGGAVLVYRRTPAAGATSGGTLPIDRHGVIREELPVPDRLAHYYDMALELERRYDQIWARLRPDVAGPAAVVPFEAVRAVRVDRTERLVQHNVLATPLPGSVQAYVFAHPAEFAAAASALNAASIQYSGQSVALQRRIPRRDDTGTGPGLVVGVTTIFRDGFPGVDWSKYLLWAKAIEAQEKTHDRPQVQLAPGPARTLALEPVSGTRVGIYGADRYVFPDLPAYYEYRVVAWSTAGRARSLTAGSRFVAPLHDMPQFDDRGRLSAAPRQQPRTPPVRAVSYDEAESTITLQIRLVHPRLHMRDEVSGLWIECDERLTLGGTEIHYGSLPDLGLGYQAYLRVNFGPEAADEVPTLTPLLSITPPLAPDRGNAVKFFGKSQDKDVHIIDTGNAPVQEADLPVTQQGDGELRFVVKLAVGDSPAVADLIVRAVRQGALERLIELSVRRGGAFSEIVPM